MVSYAEHKLLAMGDAAWTIELGADIDFDVNARCLGLAASIADAVASGELSGVVDIVPTFRSVTVHFDPRHPSAPTIPSRLQVLARAATPPTAAKRTWRLPACFDSRYAPDLQAMADRHNLSPEAVIAQFLSTPLRVYAMGFMPGFAYMASIPEGLAYPRLTTPRTQVPPKSLAIAGRMAAIYPWMSPGGWNLIGAVPIPTFDLQVSASPALFEAGDVVTFFEIDVKTFQTLEKPDRDPIALRREFLVDSP